MATISISDVRYFKSCRQKWHYSSPIRLSLRPKDTPDYFETGRAVHEALAEYYMGKTQEPWEFFLRKIGEGHVDALMGYYLLKAYVRFAQANDDFFYLQAEQRKEIKLPSGHTFSFQFDGLANRGNKWWLVEYKTTQGGLNTDLQWLQLDDQAVAYQAAAEIALNHDIEGTIYTWIRKKMPTSPRRLASGELTRRKDLNTTADMYYDTVVEQGYDPADYADIIRHFRDTEQRNFFRREYVVIGRGQRKRMLEELNQMALLMADPDVDIYPSPSQFNCARCSFYDPCWLTRTGRSPNKLLELDYEKGRYY